MQLTLTMTDGTTQVVPFDSSSTLQVSTDDAILGTWTSVASLELTDDPVEVVDGPAQVVIDPTAGVPVESAPVVPDPTSSDSGTEGDNAGGQTITVLPDGTQIDGTGTSGSSATTTADDPTLAPEPQPDVPAVDVSPVEPAVADEPTETPEPTDTTVDTPLPDSVGAALAAADAQNVADAAAAVVPDEAPAPQPDTPAPDEAVAAVNDSIDTAVAGTHPDPDAHLTNSIALVDELLVAYPDDTRLQDAKVQLADLAADLSAETA